MSSPSINHVGLNDVQPLGADSGKRDEGETKPPPPNESDYNPLLGLLTCPQCSQRALFWNRHDQIYKCVNPKCKKSFTIEEYKNREVQAQPKERQSEEIPSDVSIDKAKERMKRATKAGKHKQAMKLGTTEQIPSTVLTIETKEGATEHGITEQIPSSVATIEAKEKTRSLV
jgi:DNA-directed RNA polymerase subunit RPC12/RpoP